LANNFKNSQQCSAIIKFVIEKVRWTFRYMSQISNIQNGQQGNNAKGGGSMSISTNSKYEK